MADTGKSGSTVGDIPWWKYFIFSRGLESNLESRGEAESAGRGRYGRVFGRIYLALGSPSYKQRTEAILHLLFRLERKNLNMIEVSCWADKWF